jgi:hypothetical protein
MAKEALAILDYLIREELTRGNRLPDLLKEPPGETAKGWYMCVPPCFNDALDIKQTERIKNKKKTLMWTQGSSFSFKTGDTIYDTPDAYKVWSEALKTIGLCVQVKTGASAVPAEGDTGRFAGSVTFSILTPNNDRSKIVERGDHTMSQDEFVRFLISGPSEELKQKIDRPHPVGSG